MKFRVFVSLLSLCLATVVMVTGFTMAWFTSTDSPPPVIINSGTTTILFIMEENPQEDESGDGNEISEDDSGNSPVEELDLTEQGEE